MANECVRKQKCFLSLSHARIYDNLSPRETLILRIMTIRDLFCLMRSCRLLEKWSSLRVFQGGKANSFGAPEKHPHWGFFLSEGFSSIGKSKLCNVDKDDLWCGFFSFFAFLLSESKEFSYEINFITSCYPLSFVISVLS